MPSQISLLFVTRSAIGTGGMQTWTRAFLRFLDRRHVEHRVLSFTGAWFLLPLFMFRVVCICVFFRGRGIHLTDGVLAHIGLVLSFVRPRLRRTITLHGLDVVYEGRVYQWLLRRSLPLFHTIVCVSEATKREAVTRGARADRTIVIPPGLIFSGPPTPRRRDAPTFLLFGRQIPRKGTVWFLSCVADTLLARHWTATIVVAGAGSELQTIRRIASLSPYSNRIRVLGEVSDTKREELYHSSTHFLMPNVSVPGDMEGFGLASIEAMSRGLSVIASSLEGIIDAVTPETGLLFQSGDADSCLQAIEKSLSHPHDPLLTYRIIREKFSIDNTGLLYLSHVFSAS